MKPRTTTEHPIKAIRRAARSKHGAPDSDRVSASAKRNLRLATFEAGQEETVRVRHTLSPTDAVERCVECGRRLAPGQHELCPRCDGRLFIAAWTPQEVTL